MGNTKVTEVQDRRNCKLKTDYGTVTTFRSREAIEIIYQKKSSKERVRMRSEDFKQFRCQKEVTPISTPDVIGKWTLSSSESELVDACKNGSFDLGNGSFVKLTKLSDGIVRVNIKHDSDSDSDSDDDHEKVGGIDSNADDDDRFPYNNPDS